MGGGDPPPPGPDEPAARKSRSEAVLGRAGARINAHLPMIEADADVTLRSPREVADRLLALAIVATKAEGLEQEIVERVVAERGIGLLFSPRERAFIADPEPSEHDRIQFIWRYEAAWVLFWALKWTQAPLGLPLAICDVPLLSEKVRDTPDLAARGLRSKAAILDEADLIYRCHWTTRQAGLDGEEPSGGLEPGVTMERHHALNWLIRYGDDAPWDEVGTDT